MQQLQPNTTLQGGKYRIERVLGQGGFGNTYSGFNTVFDERIAIKEFFMQGINDRDGDTGSVSVSIERNKQQFEEQREKFKKEALRIRKLNNPHIIKVHDLFEENGTAYYVMDYVDGENLAERLKRTGKPMTEQEVRELLPQILDALKTVHDADIWHLDLKPANIMIDKAGNVKLIDFGASKQFNAQKGGATTSTAISYTNGYAPREQMEQNYDKFGPWTDIYALGATLYNLLTYVRPPLPSDIDDDETEDKHQSLPFQNEISNDMKIFVLQLIQTNRKRRPQNIGEIWPLLDSQSPKSNDSEQKTIVLNTEELEDREETIIAASKQEDPIVNQKAETDSVPYPTPSSVATQEYKEESCEFNEDNTIKSRLYFILGVVIFLIVLIIWGYKRFGNKVQEPAVHEVENNQSRYVERMKYDSYQYSGPVDDKNRPNGKGEAFFDNGDYYKGNFIAGTMYGSDCLYRYENGDEYTGGFRDGTFYNGKLTRIEDGSYFVGYFKGGWPNKGTWYSKDDVAFLYLDQSKNTD